MVTKQRQSVKAYEELQRSMSVIPTHVLYVAEQLHWGASVATMHLFSRSAGGHACAVGFKGT